MSGGSRHRAADSRDEYILPLRWADDSALAELVQYLEVLAGRINVTVVDGSGAGLFATHRARFPPSVRHMRPDPGTGNGKVTAVLTAVRSSGAERLVIADDDVRYTRESLAAVVHHLDHADLVRPQNYFDVLPWHACWDTSRTLIDRALSADFPGTFAVRRAALQAAELALLPTFACLTGLPRQRRAPTVLGLAVAGMALAEIGRRRHHGRKVFPARTAWFAPLWVMERAVCVWLALAFRLSGGVPYSGTRLMTAAHSTGELRRRHQGKIARNPFDQPRERHEAGTGR